MYIYIYIYRSRIPPVKDPETVAMATICDLHVMATITFASAIWSRKALVKHNLQLLVFHHLYPPLLEPLLEPICKRRRVSVRLSF